MRRALVISCAVLLMTAGQVCADGYGFWPPSDVEIVPQNPTSSDVVAITLSGEWPDSCIPNGSAISVDGNDIYFDVIHDYPPGIMCLAVISGWERTRSVGPLSPGTYSVYARLLSNRYLHIPAEYTLVTEFTVTAEPYVPTVYYYVDAIDGNDLNDGLTPETAFATIQKGVDTAKSGDTVIVAPGIYTGEGNRNINFYCKAIILCSTNPCDPNIVANTTIDCEGAYDYAFDFRSNEGPNSILAGFTITNGHAGIHCSDYSCPTISHCIITNNCASNYSVGIWCNNSSPTITNCTISENSAPYGRGIYASYKSNLIITNCIITDNVGADHGGGIYCTEASSLTITNCIISGNLATFRGGGIYLRSNSNAAITNCTISNNTARNYCGGGIFSYQSDLMFTNCTFFANSSRNGNALAFDSWYQDYPSNLQMSNCVLWDGDNEIWNDDNSTITITYSDVQGGWQGEGNIDEDPCFAEPGYWDPNGTPADANDDFWVDGDYHLKSEAGRWNPTTESWVIDAVTSPCIDAGDPADPIGYEPFPNGGVINMGAYGGTSEASKSYFGRPVCQTIIAGDINGDCRVDFLDFAIMSGHWLVDAGP